MKSGRSSLAEDGLSRLLVRSSSRFTRHPHTSDIRGLIRAAQQRPPYRELVGLSCGSAVISVARGDDPITIFPSAPLPCFPPMADLHFHNPGILSQNRINTDASSSLHCPVCPVVSRFGTHLRNVRGAVAGALSLCATVTTDVSITFDKSVRFVQKGFTAIPQSSRKTC